jgi:hypothetical protein
MNLEKNMADRHEEILSYLLEKRKENKDLRFWLRRQNTNNRLSSGLWFQGTDNYLSIGFSKKTAGNQSTRSIAFGVVSEKNGGSHSKIEIIFRYEENKKVIECYKKIIETIGGFTESNPTNYYRVYENRDILESLEEFLTTHKPIIDSIIKSFNLEDLLLINAKKFDTPLENILKQREQQKTANPIKVILANITWNSKDWKEISEDASGHAWVGGQNIPHESWNFDFENPRNNNNKVYGFAKFTNVPKIEGNNNFIIFYSKGKIVGFYGKAEILKDWVVVNDNESYNLIADKAYSLVLENKIDDIKDKGYLEDKARVGQVGYMYLNNLQTSLNILDEAIETNPNQSNKLNRIKKWIQENQIKEIASNKIDSIMKKEIPLNQILFGPPGTGKTYHTINKAVEIADPDFYELHKENREELKKRFKLLLLNSDKNDKGQIGFSTFHQSFSYEDFVEGIKPVLSDSIEESEETALEYEIQDGIFKLISEKANQSLEASKLDSEELISLSDEHFENAQFYKMSLGNSQKEGDQAIFDYCMENNCITTGFAEGVDFTGKNERELKLFGKSHNLDSFPIQAMNLFKNYLKNDNYVVISKGNKYVRAIGRVIGDYEYNEESPLPEIPSLNHFRKVEWIFENIEVPANEVYRKNLSQQTIYKLDKNQIRKDFFVKENKEDSLKIPTNPKNFVLIVDEINRGNISSIFGELITLIEKDKRAGGMEELSVILPYSKKEFKVPSNVFIIGTMNTADRSIEALDTALRRRFSFQEMPPKPTLIATKSLLKETNGNIDTIDVVKLLEKINDRIEKLIDKDHKIGHSYFMKIKEKSDLIEVFKDKVIPLLEEYFFGDFGKIGLILGSSFISKVPTENVDFAEFDYDSSIKNDLLERTLYQIEPEENWNFESVYKIQN